MSSPRPKGRLIGAAKRPAGLPREGEARERDPKHEVGDSEDEVEDSQVFLADPDSGPRAAPGQATLDLAQPSASELQTDLDRERSPAPAPLEIPAQLGSYRIDGELARGGMGVVLRGRHEVLARDVAIKLLLPAAKGDREAFERFLLEAQATARLRHPGIVAIHDVARDAQGTPYLVMDFIAGQTLRQRIRERGALAPKEVAEVMAVVAEAVGHAHEHGILHRDLKPDNVIIDAKGAPHLTDFGLAKLVSEEPAGAESPSGRLLSGTKLRLGLTNKGAVMGTPRYMAPEQVKGQQLTVTADVWALGVTIYEALTGKAPFPGSSVIEIFEAIVTKEPTPPTQLNPLIPARLERICLRCLNKDAADRPQSADEVARELRRAVEATTRPLRTSAPPPPLVDGSRIGRVLKAGAFVGLVLGVPLLFGPLRSVWLEPPASPSAPAPGATPVAASLEEQAEAGDPEAMARWGEHLLVSGRQGAGIEFLERAAEAGQARACLVLGQCYQHGRGVAVDTEAALAWYLEGSEAGLARSSVAAGFLLVERGAAGDAAQARDLLQGGLPGLQTQVARRACLTVLGRLYLEVAPRDPTRGVESLEQAAELGSTAAMVELARLYERGEVVAEDYAAARSWLERAGEARDPVAWIELGDAHAAGRLGLEIDFVRARELYERARPARPELVEARLKNLQD